MIKMLLKSICFVTNNWTFNRKRKNHWSLMAFAVCSQTHWDLLSVSIASRLIVSVHCSKEEQMKYRSLGSIYFWKILFFSNPLPVLDTCTHVPQLSTATDVQKTVSPRVVSLCIPLASQYRISFSAATTQNNSHSHLRMKHPSLFRGLSHGTSSRYLKMLTSKLLEVEDDHQIYEGLSTDSNNSKQEDEPQAHLCAWI